jgi:hypothetical protein
MDQEGLPEKPIIEEEDKWFFISMFSDTLEFLAMLGIFGNRAEKGAWTAWIFKVCIFLIIFICCGCPGLLYYLYLAR